MNKRRIRGGNDDRKVVRMKYDLDYLFEYYYSAKKSEGISEVTLTTYIYNYKGFCEYLDLKGIAHDIRLLNAEIGRSYVLWLRFEKKRFSDNCSVPEKSKTIGLLPKSVNTRIKNIKAMFRYLQDIEIIDADPFKNVKPLPDIGRDIEVLTADELRRLVNVPNQRKYSHFRDYVILNLLIDGMVRINEALSLREKDVNISAGTILLSRENVKTRRQRMVPITKRTSNLIRELIIENEDFDSDYIFLSNHGDPLTTNNFRHRLKIYAKEAGITKRVHPHLLRHTGATLFLEEGGNTSHLQKILGHVDGRMTAHYTHLSNKSVKESHDKNSPAYKLFSKHEKPRKTKRIEE